MLATFLIATALSAATINPYADLIEPAIDSNTAFYEGHSRTYVFAAPSGYRLVTDEAAQAGLSLAFVPERQPFDSTDILIGVTIYQLDSAAAAFADILAEDTVAIRLHYGNAIEIWPVDSMYNALDEIVPTVYVNGPASFVPTVMVSYYDGGSEIIILELIISPRQARFHAETIFETALRRFKPLRHGDPAALDLSSRDPE